MNPASSSVTVISGYGEKEAACLLLKHGQTKFLLDLGRNISGTVPDISAIGPVDAILISHCHTDHMSGISDKTLQQLGNPPVYASPPAHFHGAKHCNLPLNRSFLPLHGTTEINGINVITGQAGHSPGSVWMHFAIGEGLLYMGDHSPHSPVYRYDTPPPAATMTLDASYKGDDISTADYRKTLLDFLRRQTEIILPCPAMGRDLELALFLLTEFGEVPQFDLDTATTLTEIITIFPEALRKETYPLYEKLLAAIRSGSTRKKEMPHITITRNIYNRPCNNRQIPTKDFPLCFTGHCPENAISGMLLRQQRADFHRWPVHPSATDLLSLADAVKAHRLVPLFGGASCHQLWQQFFAPREVINAQTFSIAN